MEPEGNRRKLTGFAHFLAAAGYSAGGVARAWREAAFRQEVAAGAALVVIYAFIGVETHVAIAAAALFLVLVAVEALNTAIEEIVDRISPETSVTAKHAKDLGSFAVFCLICANAMLLSGAVYLHVIGPATS